MPPEQQLLFSKSSRRSSTPPANRRHRLPILARADGQRIAQASAGRQVDRVLEFLRAHRLATDHEIASGVGLALSNVNSLRNRLARAGIVRAVGLQEGPLGARRTVWSLVEVSDGTRAADF